MDKQRVLITFFVTYILIAAFPGMSPAWESKLFQKVDNNYQYKNVSGFKLPDFSYAGYHRGEKPIPTVPVKKEITPITGDNVSHIQNALNQAVGGALLLKPGTYVLRSKVVVPSNTVLRGSGTDKTFIHIDIQQTKSKSFLVAHRGKTTTPSVRSWQDSDGVRININGDVDSTTTQLNLASTTGLSVGDMIVVKNNVSNDFRTEYNGRTDVWPNDKSSLRFLRRITRISGSSVQIDQPIWHILKSKHSPHIIKVTYMAEEIGIENLSIGFVKPSDYPLYYESSSSGQNAAYHNSRAIEFGNVVNGWIRNVKTYSPSGAAPHIHSKGITVTGSRNITIENCDIGNPANRGKGGNGYLYVLSTSSDCLIINSTARKGRHNFLLNFSATGNVLSSCNSFESRLPSDFHNALSVSNLIENLDITGSHKYGFDISNRGTTSGGAGITGLDNVFWKITSPKNTPDLNRIRSEQASANNGKDYIIGATTVYGGTVTSGNKWREGIGIEDQLVPVSLYQEQLKLRLCEGQGSLDSPVNLRVEQ